MDENSTEFDLTTELPKNFYLNKESENLFNALERTKRNIYKEFEDNFK